MLKQVQHDSSVQEYRLGLREIGGLFFLALGGR